MANGDGDLVMAGMVRRLFGCVAAGVCAAALVGVAPAAAEGTDEVRIVGIPDSFRSGGSGGVVTVSVTRRGGECVRVRQMVEVGSPGLQHGHLRVAFESNSGWEESPLSNSKNPYFAEGSGGPETLCSGQTRTLRHRITFLAGTPAGRATIEVIMFELGGGEMGRTKVTRPITGAAARPSARPQKPSASRPASAPSATATDAAPTTSAPSTEASEPPAAATTDEGGTGAPAASEPLDLASNSTRLAAGAVGVALLAGVGIGALLLLRRRRSRHAALADAGTGDGTTSA